MGSIRVMKAPGPAGGRFILRKRNSILLRTVAGVCAGLVFVLCILAASPEAHHWLHHDSDEPGHECAVVVFAHGLTSVGDSVTPEALFLFLVAVAVVQCRRLDLIAPRYALRPERGPPVG